MISSRNLIIGVGNPDRGDDAIGLIVARQLRQLMPPGFSVIEQSGDGAVLMDLWQDAGTVIVVDAAHSTDIPGTIHRFDIPTDPLPVDSFHSSTHAFGLADGIRLSSALGRLPNRLIVYGIVGLQFELGQRPGPLVQRAGEEVTQRILRDLQFGPAK
ncbi:MAG TPA: hydrogenase maturation protease [Tepidisphaeraceae bacterium]|nr:hydrogenase maturation protease [Tepidisphaeraceae bacterium]